MAQDGRASEKLKDARENSARALSDVRKVMRRATAMGIESLTRIVQEEGIVVGEQYFGMLMDNFELKASKFQTAVEVAAQNSLFTSLSIRMRLLRDS